MLGAAAVTVTVKLHAAVLALPSVAVHVTVVVPSENVEPLAGAHTKPAPGQLSLTTGFVKVTAVEQPVVRFVVTFAGQAMVGPCVSLIVTVNEHPFVLPLVSNALQITVVKPLEKVEPLAGTHTWVIPGQLSLALNVQVTFVFEHVPASVLATMFPGHAIVGASVSLIVT